MRVLEYKDGIVGFSQAEGVDLEDNLAFKFSQIEGREPIEGFVSITKGFEEHGRDTHDYKLLIALRGLLLVP